MLSIDAFLVLIQSSNSSVLISDGENAEKQGNCASSRIAESTISQATKRIDHTERRRGSSRRRWKIINMCNWGIIFSKLCLPCSGPMYVKMWCHIWRFLSSKAKIPNAYHPGGSGSVSDSSKVANWHNFLFFGFCSLYLLLIHDLFGKLLIKA